MGPTGESHIIEHEEEKDHTMSRTYPPVQLEVSARMARTADSLNEILKENGEDLRVSWSLFLPARSFGAEDQTIMTGSAIDGGVVIS